MINEFKAFAQEEEGAITVDWVVLSAAIIATTILIMNLFGTQMIGVSNTLGSAVNTAVDGSSTLPAAD